MIPPPGLTDILTLLLGARGFLLVTLLPAIVELRRPRDDGPRLMAGTILAKNEQIVSKSLKSMEDETGFDRILIGKIAGFISILPDLEE